MYDVIVKTAEIYSTASLITPPPVLTEQISVWARQLYLSHILFMLQNMGKSIKQLRYGNINTNTPIDLTGKKQNAEFQFDTSGWKYETLFNKFPALNRNVLVYINPSGDFRGHWHRGAYILEITVNLPSVEEVAELEPDMSRPPPFLIKLMGDIHSTVTHELVHAVQSFLADTMRIRDFGLSGISNKSRDPMGYALSPVTQERLSKKPLTHSLRDIEFYPSLLDAVNIFRRFTILHSILFPKDYPLEKAIKIFVGAQKPVKGFMSPNKFFVKLRKYNFSRWQKAVKEFIKEIMADEDIIASSYGARRFPRQTR